MAFWDKSEFNKSGMTIPKAFGYFLGGFKRGILVPGSGFQRAAHIVYSLERPKTSSAQKNKVAKNFPHNYSKSYLCNGSK